MKRKLLLLHGALGNKNQFDAVVALLNDKFELYTMNFVGHGGLETTEDYSIDLFTSNVHEFLTENGIEQIDIFGYSMGGYVALNLALKSPEKVGKIITLGTKFNWDRESTAKEVRMLNPDKIKEKVPRFAQKLAKDHHPLNWEEVMKKTASMMIGLSEGKSLKETDFNQIKHEVIIGIGTEDKMVTIDESKATVEQLPNGRLAVQEGFVHPIDKIEAAQLAEYLTESVK